jgi:two-component system response regulator MprA
MARILITEDDAAIQNILRRVLNAEGYTVEVASSGVEAWDKISESQPDLLLLDLTLPGMDGREIYRRVKSAGYAFPIIVVTATASPSEALADMPHTPVLAKPFDLDQLVATVEWALRRAPSKDGHARANGRAPRAAKARRPAPAK